ncbi:hypothetical protein [Ornithinimicrobium sp. INDO-MA30-4]|nr:hypothetical protein [Ornithinimicrobium sp. INDO-MA30-4]
MAAQPSAAGGRISEGPHVSVKASNPEPAAATSSAKSREASTLTS